MAPHPAKVTKFRRYTNWIRGRLIHFVDSGFPDFYDCVEERISLSCIKSSPEDPEYLRATFSTYFVLKTSGTISIVFSLDTASIESIYSGFSSS